jgi:hypothetical protein
MMTAFKWLMARAGDLLARAQFRNAKRRASNDGCLTEVVIMID